MAFNQPSPYNYAGRSERMAGLTADLPSGGAGKPGFFKKGGMGRSILAGAIGSIGDELAGNTNYADMMALQRKEGIAQQQALMQYALDLQKAMATRDYERKNPVPNEFERAMSGAGIDPGSERGQRMSMQRAYSLASPPVIQNVPGVGITSVPRPGPPQPTPQSIAFLQQHPETAADFEERYQLPPGSAARFLQQGAGQQQPGGPPRNMPFGSPLDPNLGRY